MTRFGVPGQNISPLAYADGRLSVVPMVQAPRAPTTTDKKFPIWTEWRVSKGASSPAQEGDFWKLIRFDSSGDAIWVKMNEASTGPVITLSDTGGTKVESDSQGNIQLEGGSGITVTSDAGNNKLTFALSGSGTAVDTVDVDFNTAPGVDPVEPDANGLISIYGNTVTNGTNASAPVATHSRALNQFHIDVQLSADRTGAPANPNDAGLCSFDDTVFSVDANGYVTTQGSGLAKTITGDSGGALSPSSGNWNILGVGDSSTSGSGSTLSILSPACNSIIVDPTSNFGTHTTIASAITAASAGDIIFIRPGTYDEDLTVSKNLTFVGFNSASESAGPVVIQGKTTLSAGIVAKFNGLSFQTDGDDAFESTSAGGTFQIENCRIDIETGVFGFDVTDSSGPGIWCRNSRIVGAGSAKLINYASSNAAFFEKCSISGCTSAASTVSSGSVTLRWCVVNAIFSVSSSASVRAKYCQFGTSIAPFLNVTYLTTAGTGTCQVFHCALYSGSSSACSIGSGTTVEMVSTIVNSSATNILTGAGTLKYGNLTYTGSSITTNVTTETAYTTV